MGTCFISAHSDDICMSCFGIINSGIFIKPYYLLTVFGVSEYAEVTKRSNYCETDFTNIRLSEDEVFAKELGMHFDFFKIPDCLKRYEKVIFNKDAELDWVLIRELKHKLKRFIISKGIKNLIVHYPWGDVQHLDHRITLHITSLNAKELSVNIYYVDDFPYSNIVDVNKLKQHKVKINNLLRYQKHQVMNIYESQMCELFHNMVDILCAKNQMFERAFYKEIAHEIYSDTEGQVQIFV